LFGQKAQFEQKRRTSEREKKKKKKKKKKKNVPTMKLIKNFYLIFWSW
jgi:hypothetical protein